MAPSTARMPAGMLIDMDGVLWRGDRPLPGAPEFLALLNEHGIRFTLITNNASKTPDQVQRKLAAMGIHVRAEQVLTSGSGTASYLRKLLPQGGRVYAIGRSGLLEPLRQAGYQLLPRGDGAAAVVVGMDFELTWEKLAEAAYALAQGALFIGTNPDPSFPTERGLAPGNGAILAALQTATGRSPTIFGKPEPHLFLEGLERLGTPADQSWVVGDRLETDILGGQRAGLATALVLSGVTTRQDLESSSIQPDWVYPDLPSFCEELKRRIEAA